MERRLCLAGLLVVLAGTGCTTVHPAAPDPADATPVAGTEGCHFVVRGDDAVWWTTELGAGLRKADPSTREVLAHVDIPLGFAATDLAVGFGSVWLASGGSRPTIHRVDQMENRLVAGIELASMWGSKGRRAYVAAGEGAVWATVSVLEKLFRIDPGSGTITDTIPLGPLPASDVIGRVAAGEGAVWVLHHRTLSRIDPVARRVAARITIPGLVAGVGEILAGGGALWVAAGSTVSRIDPRADAVVATIETAWDPVTPVNRFAIGHMTISNGTLWALAFRSSGSFMEPTGGRYALVEIDPGTNTVRTRRALGAGDAARVFFGPTLAASDDALWVCQPTGLYAVPR